MRFLSLSDGNAMPALGLGTWLSEPGEVGRAVKAAVRTGYRHIDCAAIYQNEGEIGEALAELIADGEVARDALWITSKLWNNRHAADDVESACRESLRLLKLDYLDLYLMHWPVALKRDVMRPESADDLVSLDEQPLATTWGALEKLVDAKLCRSIGVSNFSMKKLEALITDARIQPAVNQIEMHPYLQQPRMLELCRERGVVLTAYSPLGSRGRPDKFKGADEPILMEEPIAKAIGERHGVTPAQVLIAWALHRGTSVIPKSVNASRIQQNFAAREIALSADDMAELEKLDKKCRFITGGFWVHEGGPYTLANLWDET